MRLYDRHGKVLDNSLSERGIGTKEVIGIVIVVGVLIGSGSFYWFSVRGGEEEEVMLSILIETTPEALATMDEEMIGLYKENHPNVEFAVDRVPRKTVVTLRKREFSENKGRYDIVHAWPPTVAMAHNLNAMYYPDELDLIVPEYKDQVSKVSYSLFVRDNRILAWPAFFDAHHALLYRKDLFEDPDEKAAFKDQYGYELGPPQTWEEYRDAAEFFHRPDEGFYGTFISGGIAWCMGASGPTKFVRNIAGREYVDLEGEEVLVDTEKTREAWKFSKEITEFCPPGWEGTDWFTALRWFKQGKFALFYNWSFFWQDLYNPEEVREDLVGEFGVTAIPAAPNGKRYVRNGGHNWIIPRNAKHPEEAAEFLRWMQKYSICKKRALSGDIFVPVRKDVREDPEVSELYHFDSYFPHPGQDEVEAVRRSLEESSIRSSRDERISHAWMKYASDEWTLDKTMSWLQSEIEELVAE